VDACETVLSHGKWLEREALAWLPSRCKGRTGSPHEQAAAPAAGLPARRADIVPLPLPGREAIFTGAASRPVTADHRRGVLGACAVPGAPALGVPALQLYGETAKCHGLLSCDRRS